VKPRPPATVSGAAVSAADLAAWIHADAPLRWTDDTHMTIWVNESLIACGGFDGHHMATTAIRTP